MIAAHNDGSLKDVSWNGLTKFLIHYKQKYRPNKSDLVKPVTDLLVADGHPARTHESETEVRARGMHVRVRR